MGKYKVEGGYLYLHNNKVAIPLSMVKILTPVYNEKYTRCRDSSKRDAFTFDLWIAPTFCHSHKISMRHIEETGFLYVTLAPSEDANEMHRLYYELENLLCI